MTTENFWTLAKEKMPTENGQYWVTFVDQFTGCRLTKLIWWKDDKGGFYPEFEGFEKVLAWSKIVKPENDVEKIVWHTKSKGCKDYPRTFVVWVCETNECYSKDMAVLMTVKAIDSVKFELWTEFPTPYDPGDGTPFMYGAPGNNAVPGLTWTLRDFRARRSFLELFGPDFGRALTEACNEQISNSERDVFVRFQSAPQGIRVPKEQIVLSEPYNCIEWAMWPNTVPSPIAVGLQSWLRVEYFENGNEKAGRFKFNGEYFYNDELTLIENESLVIKRFNLWD